MDRSVSRCRLRRVRTAVDCLDPHPLHPCRDVQPADRRAHLPKQIAQHPAACERVEAVQLVDPPHDRRVRVPRSARQIVDASATDAELLRLGRATARDHGRSLLGVRQQTCLPEHAGQKIVRQRLLTLHGGQRHLRLECRAVVPASTLSRLASCPRPVWSLSDRQTTYPLYTDSPGPPLVRSVAMSIC